MSIIYTKDSERLFEYKDEHMEHSLITKIEKYIINLKENNNKYQMEKNIWL